MLCCAGSHLGGVHRRFMRAEDGSVSFAGDMPAFDDSQFVPVEVKAGSLVVLHGANVHLRWVGVGLAERGRHRGFCRGQPRKQQSG